MDANLTSEGTPVDPSTAATAVDAATVVTPAKKSKTRRNVMIASGVVGLAGIGSTLAANINLNSGNNVEFGQGVARTAACDEDGFTINPVTYFDNTISKFRVQQVEISGLDLTPAGTGWNDSDLGSTYADQAAAKAAHPGEYYVHGGTWHRTCDNVVLDFKAYTDDANYAGYTLDGLTNNSNSSIASPVAWSQYNGLPNANATNAGFAVKVNVNDTNDLDSEFDSVMIGVNNVNNTGGGLNDYVYLWTDGGRYPVSTSYILIAITLH
jgi:hypothetical protein